MKGTVNIEIVHVNVRHVRMKYAKNTRNNCPNAKKYSITMPVNKRLLGPTNSEPSTNPDTDIPRVEHAKRNRAMMKMAYDGQNPSAG